MKQHTDLSRRDILVGGGALVAAAVAGPAQASTPFDEALKRAAGEAAPQAGRVKLDIPQITENGNSVAISVAVESPMTAADHVRTIAILAEKNPYPEVAQFHLGPRAGKAQVATTMRLATTQKVVAVATMNDGSVWTDEQEVLVTLSACTDGG